MTTLAPQATMRFSYGHPVAAVPVLWRVESRLYSTIVDAEREEFGSRPEVEIAQHALLRLNTGEKDEPRG